MAQYDNPDQWFGSKDGTVQVGDGPAREPIAQSISATNRAAYLMLPVVQRLEKLIDSVAGKALAAFEAKRWEWGNQESVPPDKRGKNNLFEAVQADNTRIHHPEFGLEALGRRLTAIESKLDALTQQQQ